MSAMGPQQYFNKKTILITGAASGVGKELAISLSDIDCTLVLIDVINLESVKKECRPSAKVCEFICDVSSEEQVKEVKNSIEIKKLNIEIIFANAGITLSLIHI